MIYRYQCYSSTETLMTGITLAKNMYVIGYNKETSKALICAEMLLRTNSTTYLTSNKQCSWAFDKSLSLYYDNNATDRIVYFTRSGEFNPNTDINDEICVFREIFEIPYYTDSVFYLKIDLDLTNAIIVNTSTETGTSGTLKKGLLMQSDSVYNRSYTISSPSIAVVSMNNFTDESEVSFSYKLQSWAKTNEGKYCDTWISFSGYTEDIVRNGSILYEYSAYQYNQSFTFNITDEERVLMRQNIPNQASKEVYIFMKGVDGSISYVKRTMSIIPGEPVFSPVIKDTNATTKALTGNESKLVRYYSNAYVASNVEPQKAASIVSHKITFGSKSTNAYSTTFNAVESNKYVFTATDSRGFSTTEEVIPPFVDYVKLTCAIDTSEPIGTVSGTMKITIHGNYYDGSFGAVDNNLGLTYRCRVKGTEWGNWVNVSNPSTYGETYSVNVVVSGLNYKNTYELQAMATDRLNSISTVVYTITTVPTFDWSRNDFNFNVPVALQDNLEVKGDTTLNGALGVEGVANFSNFTNFDGLTSFAYTPTFTNGLEIDMANTTFDSNTMADYVIETGTEAMGSNGTWKWQKWASGKAEAWGKRNYGNMGFPNEYVVGAMYVSGSNMAYTLMWQSDTFTQDLPSIFSEEPDVIDINIIKSNGNAFIIRGLDTGASASSTGGFAICKNNSTNMSAVHLGFHVVGTWKSEE